MDDISYELGALKAQNAAMKESLDQLTKDVEEIKTTVTTWKSSAAGAVFVLSIIGSILLYLGDNLFSLIKVKMGF